MKSLWSGKWSDFKSPLRVVVQFLLRSRETKVNKCRELKQKLDEAQRLLARREAELERQREEIRELKRRTQRLETEKRIQAQATSPSLPDDLPIGTHGYGPRMVSLAMNLASPNKRLPQRWAEGAFQSPMPCVCFASPILSRVCWPADKSAKGMLVLCWAWKMTWR